MQRKYQQGYVVGSAARKLEVAAPQRPQGPQEQRELKEQQRINKNIGTKEGRTALVSFYRTLY